MSHFYEIVFTLDDLNKGFDPSKVPSRGPQFNALPIEERWIVKKESAKKCVGTLPDEYRGSCLMNVVFTCGTQVLKQSFKKQF